MTEEEILAELALVNAAIATILGGAVQSFLHEGGDMATMLKLKELREHRDELNAALAGLTRGTRARFVPLTRY